MNVEISKDRIIIEKTDEFDVGKTLECGQVFRFKKLSEKRYSLCAQSNYCEIETGKEIVIYSDAPKFFYDYFDLGKDYGSINARLYEFEELRKCIDYSKGIRILRQDIFETIVSFILSSSNNISRIKAIIERMCCAFGEHKNGYNAFVSKGVFRSMRKDDFAVLKAGFRENYLLSGRDIISDDQFLLSLKNSDRFEAEKQLLSLKGVGKKVAACIMLFALGHTGAYPVDTWVYKANRTSELCSPKKVQQFNEDRYKDLAGYAQQYIFYTTREKGR